MDGEVCRYIVCGTVDYLFFATQNICDLIANNLERVVYSYCSYSSILFLFFSFLFVKQLTPQLSFERTE